ncbi:hypothetical protein JCM19238_4371 [Vibrio ponticus]|nr:hypothetical protein JCM19238_4371 [Vibrio ponticus]
MLTFSRLFASRVASINHPPEQQTAQALSVSPSKLFTGYKLLPIN